MGVVHSYFSRACPLLEEVRTRLSHLAMSFYAIRGTGTRHRLQELSGKSALKIVARLTEAVSAPLTPG